MGGRSRNTPMNGLYRPEFERDSCGICFVADLRGRRTHSLVLSAVDALSNLDHRGARGADPKTGDGAGILIQVPDRFLRAVTPFELPRPGGYITGVGLFPDHGDHLDAGIRKVEEIVEEVGLTVLGWRIPPVDSSVLGEAARMAMPAMRQVFIDGHGRNGLNLERYAYAIRKRIEHEIRFDIGEGPADGIGGVAASHQAVYFPSLSSRTMVYKGTVAPTRLADLYCDLHDDRVDSALALVHSRFSTNTFPTWSLAHPYRMIAHNGEINTIAGNRNFMRARESLLQSDLFPEETQRIFPICTPGLSDSASLDEALEFLVLGGYSLPEAMLMLIPEPWENHESMDPGLRDFYRFHASVLEPWDGPAAVMFTDGRLVGALLDRNGLRPARYWVTADDLVVMASEVGVIDVPPAQVVEKGRLRPGRMFLVDTTRGRIVRDGETKADLAGARPYGRWLDEGLVRLEDLPEGVPAPKSCLSLPQRLRAFGYTHEDLKVLISPMASTGTEPLGSMGTDTPLATLSDRSRPLFDYFKQSFAQVTNPPLDAIREEMVTSLRITLGPESNLLSLSAESCRMIELDSPVLDDGDVGRLMEMEKAPGVGGPARRVDCHFLPEDGGEGLRQALARVCREVDRHIESGAWAIVLSDRDIGDDRAPIPSLLATAAVHHHLVQTRQRTRVSLIAETGDAREVHHLCLLLGYGADAINPYMALAAIDYMVDQSSYGLEAVGRDEARGYYLKAARKGVLKVMSKIGISTVASYIGAQIFEAVGIGDEVIDAYFTGTVSRIGGIGLDLIAEEVAIRHHGALTHMVPAVAHHELDSGGEYQWRRDGELHLFNPETVYKLQHATRQGRYDIFREYSRLVDDQAQGLGTLRGLFRFRTEGTTPIPIEEVEPAAEIVKRFSTGAMSYGSISKEAHETLAIAMNRIGAKSNSGEGGEDPARNVPDANGDLRRSAVKQVASARFGVTAEYLYNADDLQIKMAQGAKPGEGGQLPGYKVYPWIAETRMSTPGVGLISPPPHHDIYSIEDIKQLIHDLKNANPEARVHVKLVAQMGVGTVAAGVVKAKADVVLISGHDGGTGASPLTSIKHAGGPWEIGLAEAQQTLIMNDLRERVVLQTDGQLKTGRDVMIAALLGADEYGFSTAPLVVSGCIMMRVCHLDTCPVGVATQNPELRQRFAGRARHVINFMMFVAEQVREHLARLGLRSMDEAIGRADLLDVREAVGHWKAAGLDLAPLLHVPNPSPDTVRRHRTAQDHGLDGALDQTLIQLAESALIEGTPITLDMRVRNVNRSVGTLLGYNVTKRYGAAGLPDDTITVNFTGSAGMSFGAFLPRGITLRLTGDANDYLGKGLSGGRMVVMAPTESRIVPEDSIIAGNVILYGATSGEAFLQGVVGERFGVRNSGATAVVEGVGDHGCEYMTGGRVVVLGRTGRNFAAGMSGGIAYVYDVDGTFPARVNTEMVSLEPLDESDRALVRQLLRAHLDETGSALAARLIEGGERELNRFMKVMPDDYRRVLKAAEEAERSGEKVLDAIMAAAHG